MDKTYVLGFIPPISGVESEFNTFRLGSAYTKRLKEGDQVFLMNEKEKAVFGRAVVVSIENAPLNELCVMHGSKNHTQIGQEAITAPERLFHLLTRIYGPHIAKPDKKATAIYLRRIE